MGKVLATVLVLLACSFASHATTLFVYFTAPTYGPSLQQGTGTLGTGRNRNAGQSVASTFSFASATDPDNQVVNLNEYEVTAVTALSLTVAYSDDEDPADAGTEAWSGAVARLDATVLQSSGAGGITAQQLPSTQMTQAVSFDPDAAVDQYLISTDFGGFIYRFNVTGAAGSDIRFRGITGPVIDGVTVNVRAVVEATQLVPEPATSALAGGALLLLGIFARNLRR